MSNFKNFVMFYLFMLMSTLIPIFEMSLKTLNKVLSHSQFDGATGVFKTLGVNDVLRTI